MAGKLVTKIVVTYTLDGDEREFTATHTGNGGAVDGMIWGPSLLNKLFYQEQGNNKYRPVDRKPSSGPGQGEWKVESRGGGAGQAGSGGATGSGGAAESGGEVESGGEMLAMGGPPGGRDCVWLHNENCTWWEFCSP